MDDAETHIEESPAVEAAEPVALTADEKVAAIIEVLRANGLSLPEGL